MQINNSQHRYYSADDTGSPTSATPGTDPVTTDPTTSTQPTEQEKNFVAMRKANEKLAKELESYKKAQADAENTKLAEDNKYKELWDKTTKEKEDLLSQMTKTSQKTALQNELIKAGMSPSVADLLLLGLLSKAEFGTDNSLTNFDKVLADVKLSTPQLFEKVPLPAGASSGVTGTTNTNANGMSIEEATRIATDPNAKEYLAKKAEVDAVLMNN